MVSCSNCGEKTDPDDLFCFNCGFSLGTTSIVGKAKAFVSKPLDLDIDTIKRYSELETRIEGLRDVPNELTQQDAYLKHLNASLMTAKDRLRVLKAQRRKEYQDVEKLEKLSIASLITRIKGTREQKLEKERIEYLNALNKEEAASNECQELERVIDQTRTQIDQLEELLATKRELENDLESLIHQICEGVTDPIEDTIEQRLAQLELKKGPLQNHHSKILRAENHLAHAASDLQYALDSLNSASRYSTWDTFFGGGFLADSMKHSRMADARNHVHHAHMNIQRAKAEVPEIPGIGAHVEEISFFWDGFMDNIFSDLAARGKIHRSRDSVRYALASTTKALEWVRQRIDRVNQDFESLNSEIKETRDALLEARRRMIVDALSN
ncbi:MAG: zinc ribbon domain-containing protein [Candidatus Hodarchaeota archaeon]